MYSLNKTKTPSHSHTFLKFVFNLLHWRRERHGEFASYSFISYFFPHSLNRFLPIPEDLSVHAACLHFWHIVSEDLL